MAKKTTTTASAAASPSLSEEAAPAPGDTRSGALPPEVLAWLDMEVDWDEQLTDEQRTDSLLNAVHGAREAVDNQAEWYRKQTAQVARYGQILDLLREHRGMVVEEVTSSPYITKRMVMRLDWLQSDPRMVLMICIWEPLHERVKQLEALVAELAKGPVQMFVHDIGTDDIGLARAWRRDYYDHVDVERTD